MDEKEVPQFEFELIDIVFIYELMMKIERQGQ